LLRALLAWVWLWFFVLSASCCYHSGNDRPDSDLDLLADLPHGMGRLGLGRVQDELEPIVGSPVDPDFPAVTTSSTAPFSH
jgi:hypothetical protein